MSCWLCIGSLFFLQSISLVHWLLVVKIPRALFHLHFRLGRGNTGNQKNSFSSLICLFGVLRRFQHCTGHITTGSWKGRGNQYIEFARVVYCKLLTNGKQLPAFPLEPMQGSNPGLRGGKRECYHSATVAPFFFIEHVLLLL